MPDLDPALTFQRTAGGLLAACADQLAFLAVPVRTGGFLVASASGLSGDPSKREPSQFWTVHRRVADEDAFRDHVAVLVAHRRDVERLDRREIALGTPTPWGVAQVSRVYAPGIIQHATAGHG